MPGGGVSLLILLPQIEALSFASQVPDHTLLLPLGLLPCFKYITTTVYQAILQFVCSSLFNVCPNEAFITP